MGVRQRSGAQRTCSSPSTGARRRRASGCSATLRAELAEVGAAVEVTHQLDAQMLGNHASISASRRRHRAAGDQGSGTRNIRATARMQVGRRTWAPLKAGEFVLGWPGETGFPPPAPQPDVLAQNGSFLVYRKLEQHVAAFRAFLARAGRRVVASDAGALGIELARGEAGGTLAQRLSGDARAASSTIRRSPRTGRATTTSAMRAIRAARSVRSARTSAA